MHRSAPCRPRLRNRTLPPRPGAPRAGPRAGGRVGPAARLQARTGKQEGEARSEACEERSQRVTGLFLAWGADRGRRDGRAGADALGSGRQGRRRCTGPRVPSGLRSGRRRRRRRRRRSREPLGRAGQRRWRRWRRRAEPYWHTAHDEAARGGRVGCGQAMAARAVLGRVALALVWTARQPHLAQAHWRELVSDQGSVRFPVLRAERSGARATLHLKAVASAELPQGLQLGPWVPSPRARCGG